MDNILEMCTLYPIDYVDEIDPYKFFPESSNTFLEDVIYEARTGADMKNPKNILQRLWNFIKKIFKWISKQISRFINFIKNVFKKKSKSVDQILSESGIKPKNSNINNKSIHVTIPSNSKSTVTMNDIDVIYKPLSLKFENDGSDAIISFNDIRYGDKSPDDKIAGQSETRVSLVNLFVTIESSKAKNDIYEIFMYLKNNDIKSFIQKESEFENSFNGSGVKDTDVQITLKQLQSFQIYINDIMKIIDDPKTNQVIELITDLKVINVLNTITTFMTNLQMGMNSLTTYIRSIYIIDTKFMDTISDIDILSKFVYNAINGGIPPKYIMYNCYLLTTKEIKGDGSKGDKENPIWGQSRLVMFPDNKDFVYKIALSQWGINSNKAEIHISKEVKNTDMQNYFALILQYSDQFTIVTQEKVDTSKYMSKTIINDLLRSIDNFFKNSKYKIVDIHKGNIGYKNNYPAIMDYGFTTYK